MNFLSFLPRHLCGARTEKEVFSSVCRLSHADSISKPVNVISSHFSSFAVRPTDKLIMISELNNLAVGRTSHIYRISRCAKNSKIIGYGR